MLPPREPLELLPELLPVERVPLDEPMVLREVVLEVPYERFDDDVPRLDDVDVPLVTVFFELFELDVVLTLFAEVVVLLLVVVVLFVVVEVL